jgi:uncharacterized protein YutE (UPF0331/DUF86 family)
MIDAELVTRKALLVAKDLSDIEPIAARGVEAYLASRLDQAAAERYLERMIGRMIDINYHLITETGHPPPSDYYRSFEELANVGVLEPAFARRIAPCAGLRNRLAHDYEDIDAAKVREFLDVALRDVPEYLRQVMAWIERRPA